MCLTALARTGVLRRAAHHILVFKALRTDFLPHHPAHRAILRSPYQDTVYAFGSMHQSPIAFDDVGTGFVVIPGGIHPAFSIGRGLHSYRRSFKGEGIYGSRRYPALIPKGAYFIVGNGKRQEMQDIVSSHLFLLPKKCNTKQFKQLRILTAHPAVRRLEDFKGKYIVH